MSSEHKRPLYAFAAVAVLCACLVVSGLRSEALVGFLEQVPAADRIAAVVAPEPSSRRGDDASADDDSAGAGATTGAQTQPLRDLVTPVPGTGGGSDAARARTARDDRRSADERPKASREDTGRTDATKHARRNEHAGHTHAFHAPGPSTGRPPLRDHERTPMPRGVKPKTHGARPKTHGAQPKTHAKPKARSAEPRRHSASPKTYRVKPKGHGAGKPPRAGGAPKAGKAGKDRDATRRASLRAVRTADHKRSREAVPARHRRVTSAAVRTRP